MHRDVDNSSNCALNKQESNKSKPRNKHFFCLQYISAFKNALYNSNYNIMQGGNLLNGKT